MTDPKYPEIKVKLTGKNGNAFGILGRMQNALRKAGVPRSEIVTFMDEAMSGDYNHLLATCCNWVSVS